MKKLIGLGLLLVGCRGSRNPNPPLPAGTQVGADTPAAAVAVGFAAAKDGDLQAFSTVWGDSLGTVRDRMDRTQLEQRVFYMLKCLRADKYSIISEAPGQQGARVLAVQVTRAGLTRSAKFQVMRGPQGRWYLYDFDLNDLNDICMQR